MGRRVWSPPLGLVADEQYSGQQLLGRRNGQGLNCVLIGCGQVVWLEVQGLEETRLETS